MCPGVELRDVMENKTCLWLLKDFLFEPKRVIEQVSQLSGGQKIDLAC